MEEPTPSLPPPSSSGSELPEDPPAKGLIGSLTDFSFESFVTPVLVRYLYILAVLGVAFSIVWWVIGGQGGFHNLVWRIALSPVLFVVGAILSRVFVEILMVFFKILELLRRLDAERPGKSPTPKV
jgi:hypothetical protein